MWKKMLFLSFLLFGKVLPAQDFTENIILDCVTGHYDSLGVSIGDELKLYENYLTDNHFLSDTTIVGYNKLFASVFNESEKELPDYVDYNIDGVNIDSYDIFNNCIHAHLQDLSDSSQLKYMYCEISNIRVRSNQAMQEIMALITTALSVDRFQGRIERYYILYNFYYLTSAFIYNSDNLNEIRLNRNDNEFERNAVITVSKNKNVYLNEQEVDVKLLKESILTLCKSEEIEAAQLLIIMYVSPEVKMGFVTRINEILREAGIKKIQFVTQQGK